MYYVWPEEDAAYEADHQYLFGDLLVAPITERSRELGMAEKKVWLPEGVWTDLFTNLTYTGGRHCGRRGAARFSIGDGRVHGLELCAPVPFAGHICADGEL